LQIIHLDGKGSVFLFALELKGSRSADGSIKSDVARLAVGWPGLDVTPPFAISPGETSLAGLVTSQFVKRGL
jgi:hypothetical protein